LLTASGLLVAPTVAPAQISVTGSTTYTQTFDTLPITGSTTFNQFTSATPTLPGWFAVRTANGTGSDQIVAGNGASNAGGLYSFGTGTSTDRALGSVGSGGTAGGSLAWGVVFRNDDTVPVNATVSYTGEQWRLGTTGFSNTVSFAYSITAAAPTIPSLIPAGTGGLPPAGFISFPTLDFTSPATSGTVGALDGNLSVNQLQHSNAVLNVGLAPGQHLTFYWSDPDHPGADHGMAIDDVRVVFVPVPEPVTCFGLAAAGMVAARVIRRRFR
jgi:hypothetical protein